ncbi:hypothetical protein VTL71DRAFT_69 [Oculimacula yallundae]|uniref:Protein kinase domain-containing protein n=1 Tax=Oculimacula yallundae TaxID=86028 RepID=A0ABR4CZ36_9HELO
MADETENVCGQGSILFTQYESTATPASITQSASALEPTVPENGDQISALLQELEERNSAPVTSISSFMALVTVIDPLFKPRSLHRPWSISAGTGQFGAVEVHRYVPKRNFDVFNDKSPIKLNAYEPDATKTGDFYAVKRLTIFAASETKSTTPGPNPFSQLADELRILAHKDLQGHPNILFLFGVSHSPSRSQSCLAEPNLVLQEGDCGDLHSFYRDSDLRFNQHSLFEVQMSICFDISVGLEALHQHGVVHCDLKPKNILIRRRNGRNTKVSRCKDEREAAEVAVNSLVGKSPFIAVLADFGGSLIFSDTEASSMRPKVWTPLWSAPECYARVPIFKTLLPKIDIYAAGLIFAFIFLQGRDVFTKVVDRGELHSNDIRMDADAVRELKLADGVLSRAKSLIRGFEASLFGVYADGRREYTYRDIMYAPSQIKIFDAILETSLHADPEKRVSQATDMLNPWTSAVRNNFNIANGLIYGEPVLFKCYREGSWGPVKYFERAKTCVRTDGSCRAVPAAFPDHLDLSSGVFDVRKAFRTYTGSLTSGLKTEILNDLLHEVNIITSLQKSNISTDKLADIIPVKQLRRAADCAYQIGLAYLEGFGASRSDQRAIEWIKMAAEWGSSRGQADYLRMASGLKEIPKLLVSQASTAQALVWASKAITENGNVMAASFLAREAKGICISSVKKYRQKLKDRRWVEFEECTALNKTELFNGTSTAALGTYFDESDMPHIFGIGHGWSILHYAVLSGSLPAVKFLIETLKADVRILSWHSETPLEVAISNNDEPMIDYLIGRHQTCRPHFQPGSSPLQNIALLSPSLIPDTIYRILSMENPVGIDIATAYIGRTPLIEVMLMEAPCYPESQSVAASTLLAFGANPLIIFDSEEGLSGEASRLNGTASPLMLAVLQLDTELVRQMIDCVNENGYTTPFSDPRIRVAGPCYELARSFFRLMQIPRSVRVSKGVADYRKAHSDMVKLLINEGIAAQLPFACPKVDCGPLGLACQYGNDEAAIAILDISPEITRQNIDKLAGTVGLDILLNIVNCGFADTIDVLLPLLINRDDVSEYNLLLAAVHHQPALIPKLYTYFEQTGKGPTILGYIDPWGASVLDLALEYELMDLAKYLVNKGANYDQYRLKADHSIDDGKQSTLASVLPRMKPIKFLMELDPKPKLIVTESGLNVFHILALNEKLIGTTVGRSEFLSIMDYFHTLDPSLIHARGGTASMTPFHIVSLQYAEIVGTFLHQHGADINALNRDGKTPLDILEFHDAGDRPASQRLTVDYSSDTPKTGIAICDYAFAGPAYWIKETKLTKSIKGMYLRWGGKRSKELPTVA